MSSFTGNQKTPNPSSFSSYQFDFGIGSRNSSSSKPLKDQKPGPTPTSTPSWAPQQPNNSRTPSWTHQPAAASLAGPTSMVGDISGKSWSSIPPPAAAAATTSSIGIPSSNPNLFGDLLGSALNQGKGGSGNVPLKMAKPVNSYSMGNLASSLPKSPNTPTDSMRSNWGSADHLGNFSSLNQPTKPIGGQQPMKSMPGVGSTPKQDPFGSLMNFGSKNSGNAPIKSVNTKNSGADSSFGSFQNAKSPPKPAKTEDFAYVEFKTAERNDFGFSSQPQANHQQASVPDPLDSLFSSSGNSKNDQPFGEMNDWDVGAEFGGEEHSGTTTELEGLPAPPAGVSSSMAKNKGMDNYKQGQYADAIKWLSWAVVLIEKSGGGAEADEVLTCRASCYKEVGEYKKAVADCTKVLEHDAENVSVLLQRALLYESTEKYRLGADDLRMVLKIDPGNRLAKSTIHRLNKMAD